MAYYCIGYLYASMDLPLVLGGTSPLTLFGWTDASLGTVPRRRSVLGSISAPGPTSVAIQANLHGREHALPAKTLHYKVHQLVDIPSSLRNFGTLFNSSEFSGERMVGIVKDHKLHSNSGG